MKRRTSMGIPRLIRRRARGQSIPLIALVLVVIIAMVGLSVDVGNTFAEERKAVSAANAASIAGMNAWLDRTGGTTNAAVYNSIQNTLKANGIDPAANPSLQITATYLNAQGSPITNAPPSITAGDASPAPDNVGYVQVRVSGTVDTFFARVVNRNTLPINATSYAGTCPSGSGVFPIAVSSDYFNPQFSAFENPGQPAPGSPTVWWPATGDYEGLTKRRIYLKDNIGVPGGFSWLQWLGTTSKTATATGAAPGSAREFEAAMSGYGTLANAFEEVVPWPSTSLPKPPTYPEKPGELNAGDWVHGNSGLGNSNDLNAIMDGHIANETRLILPIFDVATGQGLNSQIHVTRLGLFVLTDYGKENPGGKRYIDLIYLGEATQQRTACAATPPPAPNTPFELWGNISLYPEYAFYPSEYKPVQYVVVLDVSGSMNMNFIGQGIKNNTITQCTNGPSGSPPNQNCGTPQNAWPDQDERRIYVAKKALELLTSLTNMPGNPNYRADRPKDSMAVVWFNDSSPTNWYSDFSSDPVEIINTITDANKQGNDPYKSAGGTNGAAGLYRAGALLQDAPKTTTEVGKTWEYKRVVVFMTDGVSNHFLDTTKNNLSGGISDSGTYPSGSDCANLGGTVVESALCQTTDGGGLASGNRDRPITQMVKVSGTQIKGNPAVKADIYALALSSIPETGLKDGVATSPSYFYALENLVRDANGETNVDKAMKQINAQVENNVCQPKVDGTWRTSIPSDQFASVNGLVYPSVGEVVLKEATSGAIVKAPARAEGGKVIYRFSNLPRGTYQLQAYIFYKHPLDPADSAPRMYSQIFANDSTVPGITVTVDGNPQEPGFRNVIQKDLALKLFGNVCATSTAP